MGIMITGGLYRGRRLATDTRAGVIRPTSGKVREALFSSLGERVPGAAFLDLFAGSGAVGLEALSRGAREATLVESHRQSFRLLLANCRSLAAGGGPDHPAADPIHADAWDFCRQTRRAGRTFDLAFADPPFDADFAGLWELLSGILSPAGTGIVQFPWRNPPEWLEQAGKVKRYGESGLAFLERPGEPR